MKQFLLRTDVEISVAFRSAKERGFRGAKGDNPTDIDSPVLRTGKEATVGPLRGTVPFSLRRKLGQSPLLAAAHALLAASVLFALAPGTAAAQEPSALAAAAEIEKAVVDAIARAEGSVVAIARVRRPRADETAVLEFRPDPFGRVIATHGGLAPTDPDFVPNQYATGVVIDRQGLILTAYHVLGPDSDYYVTTAKRKVYRASVKGADPRSDLAVLAIAANDLAPITLGDAGLLKKGQIVIALGNPYAIGRDGQVSASWGIVANLARKSTALPDEPDSASRQTLHQFGTLIQTDAKLNLGASGGALVNLRGEMVGLTVALAAAPGYEQAAGYAIPIDATFRRAIDVLHEGREVEYGFLGVRPANIRPQELLQGQHGVRVQDIVAGTPAARAGLKLDDLITSVGGVPIHNTDGLMLEVGRQPAGARTRLRIERSRQPLEIEVALGKYPVQGKKIVTAPTPSWRGMRIDYATVLAEDSPAGTGRANVFEDGVAVVEVAEGSAAWKAGLRPGVVIAQVEQTAVHAPQEFRAAVAGRKGPVQVQLTGHDRAQPTVTISQEP